MQEWKTRLAEKMAQTGLREVSLREVANQNGIKHINRQDSLDILHLFVKNNPTYRIVQMVNDLHSKESLFTTAVVTENEYQSEAEWRKEVAVKPI